MTTKKNTEYQLRVKNNKTCIFTPKEFKPSQKLDATVRLIENSSHSVPLVMLTHKQPIDDFLIIYSHGNSSDLSDTLMFLQNIALNFNIDVVGYDYSGYGESRVAVIGEETIVQDLKMLISWLKRPLNRIILWGFSLGSYPTVNMAAHFPGIAGMVLQCPIASINCLFQSNLTATTKFKEDHFSNIQVIEKVSCMTFLVHSLQDQIIPISHARILFDKFTTRNSKDKIWFLEIAKLKHNGLHRFFTTKGNNDLKSQFVSFLSTIRKAPGPSLPDPKTRIDSRFLVVEAELDDDDDDFEEERFQLLALSETQKDLNPGRRFSQNRRIIPKCFD